MPVIDFHLNNEIQTAKDRIITRDIAIQSNNYRIGAISCFFQVISLNYFHISSSLLLNQGQRHHYNKDQHSLDPHS